MLSHKAKRVFAFTQPHPKKCLRTVYAPLKTCFLIRGDKSLQLPKRNRRTKMFRDHCSTPRVSSLAMRYYIVLVRVAQSIVYYYDLMNLIYSFECFLIIADVTIRQHEKVRTIYPK